MSQEDRDRWNRRYRGEPPSTAPSAHLLDAEPLLPPPGRALDVAGGGGRNALWLAQRGWDVTLTDVSDEALRIAGQRAAGAGLSVRTVQCDFDSDPLPAGPWHLIVSFHFLDRRLFAEMAQQLDVGGVLVFVQATRSNLQRFEKPPAHYLLDDGELPTLLAPLRILRYEEGWLAEGRHDAFVVAERSA